MKTSLVLIIPLVAALAACGAPNNDDFVSKAEEAGEFEIGSSRLAKNKSQNAAVKQFADQMETVAEIGEVGVDAVLPGVAKSLHLFRLA